MGIFNGIVSDNSLVGLGLAGVIVELSQFLLFTGLSQVFFIGINGL